jgi:hypothetical protein
VESIIKDQGLLCFVPWLEFHDRYAGYVEVLGRDSFVWGLAHEDPHWLAPRKVDIDSELGDEIWYATCADAHPSYNYRLDNKGEFLGGPATTFDVHVERVGAYFEFQTRHRSRLLTNQELLDPDAITIRSRDESLVPEASDSFFRYYMSNKYLLVEDVETGRMHKGLIAID